VNENAMPYTTRRCGKRYGTIWRQVMVNRIGVKEKNIAGLSQGRFGEKTIPRGVYWVPGPNYIWSADGHMKLGLFGIVIYAGFDAYSRYITWIYSTLGSPLALRFRFSGAIWIQLNHVAFSP